MTIQATYRKTGLTPDDVLNALTYEKPEMFNVKRRDDGVHVMLYPNEYPNVKIQISRHSANVWSPSFDQLDEIEDLLNRIFGDGLKSKPFKERDILFHAGELRKIQETLFGMISTLVYYYPRAHKSEIADAVYQIIQHTDSWVKRPK